LRNLSTGNYLRFSALADLYKEKSTKSNDNAAASRRKIAAHEHFRLSGNRLAA
jgi:hypothetical protein